YVLYLSWIVFPAHHIPLHADPLRWGIATGVVALAAFFVVRGPDIARVAVAGVVLALLPFVPVEIWTASRYTYGAVAFFAPLAAMAAYEIYDRSRQLHHRVRVPATLVGI